MKDLVLLPVKFIAVLVVLLVLCAGLQVFADFSQLSPQMRAGFGQMVPGLVAKSIYSWFIPIAALSALAVLSGIVLKRSLRWAQLFVLLVVLSAVFFGSFVLHAHFFSLKSSSPEIGFSVPEKAILAFDGGYAVAMTDTQSGIQGILYHAHEPNARFEYLESAVKNNEEKSIVIGERGTSIPLAELAGVRVEPFMVPSFFAWPLKVVQNGAAEIFRYTSASLVVASARAAGLAFILVSLWLFVRLTRWQLFNAIVTVFALFGVFAIANFAGSSLSQTMFSFVPELAKPFLLPAAYGLFGLFLCGCSLFLPSMKNWSPESAS